jgi:hypothetical protein
MQVARELNRDSKKESFPPEQMGHFESQGTTIKLTIFYYIEAGIK